MLEIFTLKISLEQEARKIETLGGEIKRII
jgi:hypothetical protein